MNIKVNTAKIAALNPCDSRFDNWKNYYLNFNGCLEEFLDLPYISASDKIWVAVRLLPRRLLEIFAIDCAIGAEAATYDDAAAYAAATYAAADAADAATYDAAADAATYAADAAERQTQIEVIIWLAQNA